MSNRIVGFLVLTAGVILLTGCVRFTTEPSLTLKASVVEGPCPLTVEFDIELVGPPGIKDNFILFFEGMWWGLYPVDYDEWPHTVTYPCPGVYAASVDASDENYFLHDMIYIEVLCPEDPDYLIPDDIWPEPWWLIQGLPEDYCSRSGN